ncbi:hypothetical protein PENTCL1PPCAC_26022, partial [Pristionchus entomophagus]
MGKVVQIVVGVGVSLALLGTLGVGIASLITLLNVQNVQNDQFADPSGITLPTTKAVIPVAKPIQDNDPRFGSYKGMSDLLKSWMNTSINPCDDFYSFTCGAAKPDQGISFDVAANDIAETLIGELNKPVNFFDNEPLPVRQMKWFYDACFTGATDDDMAARSAGIFNDLRSANPGVGFPALYPDQTKAASAEQLAAFLGYAVSSSGTSSLVKLVVDADWKDSHDERGGYVLYTDHPVTMFGAPFYSKVYDTYNVISSIVDTFKAGARLLGIEKIDEQQMLKDGTDLAQLDYDLAMKYSTDGETRRQVESMYNPRTVEGLQTMAPFINWKTFLNKALTPISTTVDGSFRVIAKELNKLSLLSTDILSGAISSRTLNNYLYYHVLTANYLPAPDAVRSKSAHLEGFRLPKHSLHSKRQQNSIDQQIVSGRAEITDRMRFCEQQVSGSHTWANTRLFVDTMYPTPAGRQQLEDQADSFLRSLVAAFRAQIDLLDWMTPATKKGSYQKIDNIVLNIAFPNWVLDDDELSSYYKKVDTKQTDSYLVQLDKMTAFGVYEWLFKIVDGEAADRKDFFGSTTVADATYKNIANSISVPLGILRAPFFDPNNPAALNYGALGFITSHELTLGFDDGGAQWEGTGLLYGWTDANSTKAFNRMAQCVVNQYGEFCPLGSGQPCVDGRQTKTENVADNGGIQTAYKAFKSFEALHGPDPLLPGDSSVFNADQLFFLGFAQVMCQYPPSTGAMLAQILAAPFSPPEYGILGALQNFPSFQKAFNCPVGSTYAPVQHCNVWTSEATSGAPLNDKGEPVVPDNEVHIAPVERISPQDMDKYSAYQTVLDIYKSSANMSENPCEDFYHYSCGNFQGPRQTTNDMAQAVTALIYEQMIDPDYQPTIKASTALTKLQTLYNSCKAEAAESTIAKTDYLQPKVLKFRQYLNQDIPLIGGAGKVALTSENYGNVLGYLSFQLGIDTLVSPGVDTNWVDPQAAQPGTTNGYQLFVDQPTTYNARAFYENENWEKQKPGYKMTVKRVVEAYAKQDKTASLTADYDGMIDAALELEKTIAITYSGTDQERRAYQRQWNPMLLDAFPATVDWTKYWSFAPKEATDWIKTKTIVMNEKDKTPALFTFLVGKKDDATLVNYLFIRLIMENSGLIPCANGECASMMKAVARKRAHSKKSRIPGRRHLLFPSFASLNDDDADGLECADEIAVMADAQGRVYIDARFPTDKDKKMIRETMKGVMINIVDAMKGMIHQ